MVSPQAAPTPRDPARPPRLAARLSLFYGATCLPIGVMMPFFPVWLADRDFTPEQIALALALGSLLRVVMGPLFAFFADRVGDQRRIALLVTVLATTGYVLFPLAHGVIVLTILSALVTSLYLAVVPLSEAVSLRADSVHGVAYGRVRLWGSITFILGNVGSGYLVQALGAPVILGLLIASTAFVVVAALLLPQGGRAVPEPAVKEPSLSLEKQALALVRSPPFLLFIGTAAFVQSAHAVYYGFGTLNWQRLGYNEGTIGALWATGVVAEIVLFLCGPSVVARFGPERLLAIAGIASIVRFGLTSLSPPLALLFPIQALHGLTFGAGHLGAMRYIVRNVPARLSSTAQGLYSAAIAGAGMSVATAIAGPLYAAHGAQAYLFAAAIGFVGALGGVMMLRRASQASLESERGARQGSEW